MVHRCPQVRQVDPRSHFPPCPGEWKKHLLRFSLTSPVVAGSCRPTLLLPNSQPQVAGITPSPTPVRAQTEFGGAGVPAQLTDHHLKQLSG